MSFLKGWIKIELDKKKETQESPSTTSSEQPTQPKKVYSINKDVSEEVKEHFYEVIKENNPAGPDFYEFHQMIKAMAEIPVEQTKYFAAFTGLKVQGLTKSALLTSIDTYKSLVQSSMSEFEEAYNLKVDSDIKAKKTEIEEKTALVNKLNEQIQSLSKIIEKLSSEVTEAESSLIEKKEAFLSSGQAVLTDLDLEKEKINKYIS